MVVHDTTFITLNSQQYRLVTEQTAARLERRRWQVESKKQATTIQERPDVRPGDTPDEFVVTWRDWSKGVSGDHENLPGTAYIAEGVTGFVPGALRPISASTNIAQTTNDEIGDPSIVIVYNGIPFHIRGNRVYRYSDGAETQDLDASAAGVITDAVVHNNELVIGFGGSTNKIRTRNTAGTWTTAADATYCSYFAKVEDRLWTNQSDGSVAQVSQIGPTDNPLTLANWSADISVGDDDYAITDLNGYGERLVVSKQEGMFLGDRGAIFPNVLAQFGTTPDQDNGKGTFVRGADIFYPHAGGCVRYDGFSAEEVGIGLHFRTADTTDTLPGTRIRSMSADGAYVWAATQFSGYPRANPTGFQTTTDGSTYTSYTTQVTDGDLTTEGTLDSLVTIGANDWWIVGYSAPFYGVLVDLTAPSGVTSGVIIGYYWNGSAWTQMPAASGFTDKTNTTSSAGSASGQMTRSGYMTWINSGLGTWAAATINGINAYWIRFAPATYDSKTRVGECRVLTTEPRSWLWRGRLPLADDPKTESVIWESYGPVPSVQYPAMLITSDVSPHNRGKQIHVAGKQVSYFFRLPPNDIESNFADTASGFAIMPKHDAGAPFVNKQWTQINLKGRTIDSDRDVALAYRTDETTSFTSVSSSITSSPSTNALTSVTGYAIQPKVTFNAFANDVFSEVNYLEAVGRYLWTYKESYSLLISCEDGTSHVRGGRLPNARVQLTNLEALRGTTVTLIDPMRQSKTVTVFEVAEVETYQTERNHPAVTVQLRCVET